MDPVLSAVAGAFAGAIIGSFIATIALRWPDGRSISARRSSCDGCGEVLRFWELIPILSWIALRGRCARCGAGIAPTHAVIEVGSALIGGAALWFSPDGGGMVLAMLGWQLLLLGWLDAHHMWLPHGLSGLLAASGLGLGGYAMASVDLTVTASDRLIGLVVGYGALALIALAYRALRGRDGLGGGDAPMLGAIGAWLGWAMLPMVVLFAALAGIALALCRIPMRHRVDTDTDWRTMRLPLGTLMALAVPAVLASTAVMARPAGFEPATGRVEVGNSIQLSYGRVAVPLAWIAQQAKIDTIEK